MEINQLTGIYRVTIMTKKGCRAVNLILLAFRDFIIQMERSDMNSLTQFIANARIKECWSSAGFPETVFGKHCYVWCDPSCQNEESKPTGLSQKKEDDCVLKSFGKETCGLLAAMVQNHNFTSWKAENLSHAQNNGIGGNRVVGNSGSEYRVSGPAVKRMWNLGQIIRVSSPHFIHH